MDEFPVQNMQIYNLKKGLCVYASLLVHTRELSFTHAQQPYSYRLYDFSFQLISYLLCPYHSSVYSRRHQSLDNQNNTHRGKTTVIIITRSKDRCRPSYHFHDMLCNLTVTFDSVTVDQLNLQDNTLQKSI